MSLDLSKFITYQYMIQKDEIVDNDLPYIKFTAISNFEPSPDEVMRWQKREHFDCYKFGFYNFSVNKFDEYFLVKWDCRKY